MDYQIFYLDNPTKQNIAKNYSSFGEKNTVFADKN